MTTASLPCHQSAFGEPEQGIETNVTLAQNRFPADIAIPGALARAEMTIARRPGYQWAFSMSWNWRSVAVGESP